MDTEWTSASFQVSAEVQCAVTGNSELGFFGFDTRVSSVCTVPFELHFSSALFFSRSKQYGPAKLFPLTTGRSASEPSPEHLVDLS
jgi:hypothetical protein